MCNTTDSRNCTAAPPPGEPKQENVPRTTGDNGATSQLPPRPETCSRTRFSAQTWPRHLTSPAPIRFHCNVHVAKKYRPGTNPISYEATAPATLARPSVRPWGHAPGPLFHPPAQPLKANPPRARTRMGNVIESPVRTSRPYQFPSCRPQAVGPAPSFPVRPLARPAGSKLVLERCSQAHWPPSSPVVLSHHPHVQPPTTTLSPTEFGAIHRRSVPAPKLCRTPTCGNSRGLQHRHQKTSPPPALATRSNIFSTGVAPTKATHTHTAERMATALTDPTKDARLLPPRFHCRCARNSSRAQISAQVREHAKKQKHWH